MPLDRETRIARVAMLAAKGISTFDIAARLGVSPSTVRRDLIAHAEDAYNVPRGTFARMPKSDH